MDLRVDAAGSSAARDEWKCIGQCNVNQGVRRPSGAMARIRKGRRHRAFSSGNNHLRDETPYMQWYINHIIYISIYKIF
ncbi:hypothetical protein K4H00_22850, partial [Mycobacterium tuberculosis]|nr:hypothetical protein [Mycobacterium tuberculosis]